MTIVLFVLMAFLLRVLPYRQINVKASFFEAVLSCLLAMIMSLLLKSSGKKLTETIVVIVVCFIVCQFVAMYQKKKRLIEMLVNQKSQDGILIKSVQVENVQNIGDVNQFLYSEEKSAIYILLYDKTEFYLTGLKQAGFSWTTFNKLLKMISGLVLSDKCMNEANSKEEKIIFIRDADILSCNMSLLDSRRTYHIINDTSRVSVKTKWPVLLSAARGRKASDAG